MVTLSAKPFDYSQEAVVSSVELLSPLFLAVPTPRVNELLGTLGEFVKRVQAAPTEPHELVLQKNMIEIAREELGEYQKQSLATLDKLRVGLEGRSGLPRQLGLRDGSLIISQKEPDSWSTKVARRLLSDDRRDWVKDIHRIALVVGSESDLLPAFVALKNFIEGWKTEKDGIACEPFLGSLKGTIPNRQLAARLEEFDISAMPAPSRWEGIKGVAYFKDMLLEFQIKTKGFLEREKDPGDPASHAAHKNRQEERAAEHAEQLGLPPHFVPFLANLIQRLLVDPGIPRHPFPPEIAVTLSD